MALQNNKELSPPFLFVKLKASSSFCRDHSDFEVQFHTSNLKPTI